MSLKKLSILLLILGLGIGFSAKFFAGSSSGTFDPSIISSGDTAWVLVSAALVMIMTPAVGFFYGGMVSSKNIVSVLKQSMVILAIVSLQWVIVGYSLVFGKDFGGNSNSSVFFWHDFCDS